MLLIASSCGVDSRQDGYLHMITCSSADVSSSLACFICFIHSLLSKTHVDFPWCCPRLHLSPENELKGKNLSCLTNHQDTRYMSLLNMCVCGMTVLTRWVRDLNVCLSPDHLLDKYLLKAEKTQPVRPEASLNTCEGYQG